MIIKKDLKKLFKFNFSCENFDFPNDVVGRLMVWHANFDAWKFEWIRIVFDDESFVQCEGGEYIDDETSLLVQCL